MTGPAVSIVLPCWNDEQALQTRLSGLVTLEPRPQLIVADASTDRAAIESICQAHAAELVFVEQAGRGAQLNAGAALATGDIIAFLHADTEFTAAHYEALRQASTVGGEEEIGAGCFYKDVAAAYPSGFYSRTLYRFYARHLGILYGDLCVFVRRALFEEMGGYDPLPLMEDVAFSSRLRDNARVRWLDPPIVASSRKFERDGFCRRKLSNIGLTWLFRLGVPAATLHRIYYGRGR